MADELISRQAILEEVDKAKYAWQDYDEMRYALSHVPAVDAVEVVRCKDCKYGAIDDDPESFSEYYCGYEGCTWHSAEHFCSYGERREENGGN